MAKRKKKRETTVHRFAWREFKLRTKHTPDYMGDSCSMLELFLVAPKGAPLPVTDTGYRSHFIDERDLVASGGPIAFWRAELDREAKTKAWHKAEFMWRQGICSGDRRPLPALQALSARSPFVPLRPL